MAWASYLTPVGGPDLLGTFDPSSAGLSQDPLQIIAGEVCRRNVRLSIGGSVLPFTGALESATVVFTLKLGGAVVFDRECTEFLRCQGWFFLQLNEIDTSQCAGSYTWDLWCRFPDGVESPLTTPQTAVISPGAHKFMDFAVPSTRPQLPALVSPPSKVSPRFAIGRSSKPARVGSVGNSRSAGGVIAVAALGSWQWWVQYICHLYGKDIIWVGPPGLSDASPTGNYPTQIFSYPWAIANMGFSGATIQNIVSPASLGIQPYWDGTVADYMALFLPDFMLDEIGVNDLKSPTAQQTAAATNTRRQTLWGIWLAKAAAVNKTVKIASSTIIPPGRTFSVTPAYPAYFNAQFAQFRDLWLTFLATQDQSTTFAVDLWDRANTFIGEFGEDYCGSADGDKTAFDLVAAPSTPWVHPDPAVAPINYSKVGAATAGSVTGGMLTDGLHENFNNGCRIKGEMFASAILDQLPNKVM